VTKVIRNVIVREYPELPDNMFPGDAKEPVVPGEKIVYLTFDDGPGEYTNYLLDVLKKYDVKATFFVVNRGRHDILKRIAEEGHTLAMHCSSHNYRDIYASEEAYFKDLKEIQDIIYEVTGQKSTIVRFPGGSDNTASYFNPGIMTRLTMMLDAMGYRYFDWNVSARDSLEGQTTERAAGEVIYGLKHNNVSVVLQHDLKLFSVRAVETIIKWGLENGYTFLPLSGDSPTCESRVNN
jgi:peptidoglycan/xylan/chitin deacetylase (PgdA/CDA1 family)